MAGYYIITDATKVARQTFDANLTISEETLSNSHTISYVKIITDT